MAMVRGKGRWAQRPPGPQSSPWSGVWAPGGGGPGRDGVEEVASSAPPVGDLWLTQHSRWARGWRRVVFPGIFLAYLAQTAAGVARYATGAAAVAGYLIIAAFVACYLALLWRGFAAEDRWPFWPWYLAMVALWVAEIPLARQDASVMCMFLVTAVMGYAGRRAFAVMAALAVVVLLVPALVPSWHAGPDLGDAFVMVLVGLSMFGFFNVIQGNRALVAARIEIARLAAENERNRIARDLHDLLGHSLTSITVKAGLARRLGATDAQRALEEIGEVEELARRALAEVRAAVSSYREVTLAGELATGKEMLRAAGIVSDLPRAVDVVDARHQELFGWVVREGLTNVVRHARASTCTVRLERARIEIVDDGRGGAGVVGCPRPGNGLTGLRERAQAEGGTVVSEPLAGGGWRLAVEVGG
jgi:two-component system sensor histidine kinase DesK